MPSYVVIGASRGIGYQFLKTLSADPKNTVIGTARNTSATETQLATDKIKNVPIVAAEMDSPTSMAAAAAAVAKITPSVDYLIVNGGYISDVSAFLAPSQFIGQESFFAEEFQKSMATNAAGVLYTINAFLPLVRAGNVKKVVVLGSGLGDYDSTFKWDIEFGVPYSMSKAAVNLLIAKYGAELKGEGFTFLSLSPGMVMTRAEDVNNRELLPSYVQQAVNVLTAKFQKGYPDFKGPISPAESVDMCLKVIDQVTPKESGAFLSHHGNKKWL
ncbi:NAD(P)-binding protein [Polyplosphaeria fusca]|uniref:NAD(P)-binding protein n=1 Tax=Polyplosphaeria fusca TaxID=682080 RepID=A0A9P4QSW5_9PLEO|nr:NAD(P)-binding protein [Polyplosphaeria fusca]